MAEGRTDTCFGGEGLLGDVCCWTAVESAACLLGLDVDGDKDTVAVLCCLAVGCLSCKRCLGECLVTTAVVGCIPELVAVEEEEEEGVGMAGEDLEEAGVRDEGTVFFRIGLCSVKELGFARGARPAVTTGAGLILFVTSLLVTIAVRAVDIGCDVFTTWEENETGEAGNEEEDFGAAAAAGTKVRKVWVWGTPWDALCEGVMTLGWVWIRPAGSEVDRDLFCAAARSKML